MRGSSLSLILALSASGALADDKPNFSATSLKAPFLEQFTDDWSSRWTPSEATKKTPVGDETYSYVGKWEVEESSVYPAISGDFGLVAKSKAAHHAISAPFGKAVDFKKDPLVVQYEVKYQQGGNCGGGYIKLLRDGFQSSGKEFDDKTPWVVMFGPDLTCPGTKVHFIFQHKNPITGEYEEKHLKTPPKPTIGKTTMLYTLVINPDNTYQVFVNGDSSATGSLLEDFNPPVNPEKEIDDPNDTKPDDWVDQARIPDPDAEKPVDWDEDAPLEILDEEAEKPEGWLDDEPESIPDPEAEKPEEWDEEEDGEWLAPIVRNPKCDEVGCGEWKRPMKRNPDYKGKWSAPYIDNPSYKGPWAPRKIPNPEFFEDSNPVSKLDKIGGIGIELWTMTEDILFDNIYVGHSLEDAKALAAESFDVKRPIEDSASSASSKLDEATEEVLLSKEPVAYIQKKLNAFIEMAKIDPILAIKMHPETAVAFGVGVVTLLGMLGTLFGVIGAAQKPVTKSPKKTDTSSTNDKNVPQTAPVSEAADSKGNDSAVKKRK